MFRIYLSDFTSPNKVFYICYWQITFHTCCEKAHDEPLLHNAFIKDSNYFKNSAS